MLAIAAPADGRGRVSNPAPRQADPDLPTHPLGGFSVAYLMNRAGIEPPNTMTAIDWRLRAVVRSDNEVRFGDANWLAAQNMATGQATIHLWRERNGKYCRMQTMALQIAPGSEAIVPLNSTMWSPDDVIWLEYWPSYTLSIEGATAFGVWNTFGSITQSSSSSEPHEWWQIVPEEDVSCE